MNPTSDKLKWTVILMLILLVFEMLALVKRETKLDSFDSRDSVLLRSILTSGMLKVMLSVGSSARLARVSRLRRTTLMARMFLRLVLLMVSIFMTVLRFCFARLVFKCAREKREEIMMTNIGTTHSRMLEMTTEMVYQALDGSRKASTNQPQDSIAG